MNNIDPIRPRVSKVKVSVKKIYQDPQVYRLTFVLTATDILTEETFDCYPNLRFPDGFEFSTDGMTRKYYDPPTNKVKFEKNMFFDRRPDGTGEVDELRDGNWYEAEFKNVFEE